MNLVLEPIDVCFAAAALCVRAASVLHPHGRGFRAWEPHSRMRLRTARFVFGNRVHNIRWNEVLWIQRDLLNNRLI